MKPCSRFFFAAAICLSVLSSSGCSLFATRPVQDMADTAAAIRAAREVQADTLAPDLFRQSTEWFSKARKEYKFKNFAVAREYAIKARRLAEQAEFSALSGGATRASTLSEPTPGPAPTPYDYPTPEPTPVEVYDQRRKEAEQRNRAPGPGSTGPGGSSNPSSLSNSPSTLIGPSSP